MAQPPSTSKLRVNDQTYEFGITLFNSKDTFFAINTAALVKLCIEEDSREWFKRGYLIVDNKENLIERRPNEFISSSANYKFRNDGRDLLLVNIKPVYDTISSSVETDAFPDGWELNYIFSIYDVQDIPGNKPNEKNIKLYFWELDYQLFAESTSVGWNTNDTLYRLYPELRGKSSVLSDEKRKVPTGEALKSLIESTLNTRSGIQKFNKNWDPGASKIFYNPPTNNQAIDDLEYLLNRHVASKKYGQIDGDVPLLYRDRYTKEWTLTSLANEMSLAVVNKAAGPWQLEQFFLTSATSTGVIIPSLLKTPQTTESYLNLNFGGKSSVNNYQFVDMSALDNAFALINMPCASNSLKDKQFNVDFEDNTVDNIKKYFQNNYVQKFSNNRTPTALLSLNKTKTENVAYRQPYSYGNTKLERYPEARNAILKSGLFLNQCLHFTAPGTTLRKCNRFIGLDRQIGSVDADFDEKFLGQWYLVKVEHVFTQKEYTNNITAVKPFADKDTRIADDVL
jgi:hypothetical protein